MISKLAQAMPRFFAGGHIAGDGLQERLRSTIFALFGVATAVGLVLVGIAYNQGWPDFVDSPIPGLPSERVGDAAVVRDAVRPQTRPVDGAGSPGSTPGSIGPAAGRTSDPRVSSQRQLSGAAPDGQAPGTAPSDQGGAGTPGSPAQAPAAEPPTPAGTPPAPAPTPVSTAPPPSTPAAEGLNPGNGKGKAKGHAKNGKPTPPASVVPTVPSASPEPVAPPPDPAAAAEAPGKGNGHAKGHSK